MLKVAGSAEDRTQAKREHALIRIMVDTRRRVSEAVNLKADDVHLAGGKWYLFVRDKGDKSRDVEVSEDLAQELLAMEVADFALAQYVQETAHRWIRRIAEKAGVTKQVGPHRLRHTHAHNLRLRSYSLEATSYRLRYADVRITTRYTRPTELSRAEKLPNMPWVT